MILSCTVWRLAPETGVTLPVKLAMLRLPRGPVGDPEPQVGRGGAGLEGEAGDGAGEGAEGVNTWGEPPSVPLVLIV